LKKAVAILFVILVAWQPAIKVYVYICWKANEAYIAQNHCENMDSADMECGGNCQLVKELKKADAADTPLLPHEQLKKTELPAFINTSPQQYIDAFESENGLEYIITDKKLKSGLFTCSVFQPPEGEV
jgi:hypothetical protein